MPSTADLRFAFNRGEIGKTALARVDREGLRLAAETMVNWMPLPQGPMMLRPGSGYLGNTLGDNVTRLLPFVFSRDDTVLLELTSSKMRVWIDDEPLSRVSVTTDVKSGTFSSSSGWSLFASSGATADIDGGKLVLAAVARGSKARARQTVPVSSGNRNKEHALRVVVTTGPIYFKVGSAVGLDDYVKRTALGTGTHSLAFTPDKTFSIEFENKDRVSRSITSCTIEASGDLDLPTIWTSSNFDSLQFIQSGDIVYVASVGKKPQKIERRSARSWSIVDYVPQLGPLRAQKDREDGITLKSSVYEGNGKLTASESFFESDHVGMIFRLFTTGQRRTARIAAEDTWSEPIRINGVGHSRWFAITVSGTWSGKLRIQRSLDGDQEGFTDVNEGGIKGSKPFITQNGTSVIEDDDFINNTIAWYRVGFKSGEYNSGVAVTSFDSTVEATAATGGADVGGTSGEKLSGAASFVRITSITSSTIAQMEVLKPVSSLTATKDWMAGEWNHIDGYPSAVTLFDGRLWWGGKDRLWGSISDDYENFDHDFKGDAGPISRSLGTGPVDTIAWLLALARLMVGRGAAISSIRSGNFDEPLTPTNFTIRDASTRGAALSNPGQVDSRGVYIHANGRQLFELLYQVNTQDYVAADLTQFNLDVGLPGFSRLAVAHSPDTRVYVIREDGQMAVLLRDHDGDIQLASWYRYDCSGDYEDVVVLPGDIEDRVYVVINRDGHRTVELLARRDECIGAPETKCLDSHIVYSGSPTKTITGLDHLEGRSVRVWGAASSTDDTGRDLGTYKVTSGHIGSLPISVRVAVVGLSYTGTFRSAKLAYGAGLSIGSIKKIDQISFVLLDTHAQGLRFGQDLNVLDPMPLYEDGELTDTNYVWPHYDKRVTMVPGRWDVDARLSLVAQSPRPATVAACLMSVDASARSNQG